MFASVLCKLILYAALLVY